MLILLFLLLSIFYGITYVICDETYRMPFQVKTFIAATIVETILISTIFSFITYSMNSKEFYDLKTMYEINIPNKVNLVKNLNSKVLIHSEFNNLIIDVANQGQSGKNTDEWNDLVSKIEEYNKKLTEFFYAKEHPYFAFCTNGFYPPITGLKFIKLNEI